MRVLFIVNIPAPYRVDFFNELGKYCDLTVLYEHERSLERNNDWIADENKTYKAIFLKSFRTGVDNGLSYEVIKHIKQFKNDIIVVGGYSTPTAMLAIMYMKLHKIKYFLNADGGQIATEKSIVKKIKTFFIGKAHGYLSTGEQTDKYFAYYGADKSKMHHYPFTSVKEKDVLSLPVSESEKSELREGLGLPIDKKIVITVGQFIHRKGFDILLEGWKKYNSEYILLIIGGGPLKEEYEKYNLKNVHILDFKKKDELSLYYRAADVFVLPTREDIWGLVVNEAMAAGLPVVSTDRCVAAVELVKNGDNGFVVKAEDIDETYNAIDKLLSQEFDLYEIGKNNIKKIYEQYTIEQMAKVTIKDFKKGLPVNG